MTFEEYRKSVLEEIGADPNTNVRYFEDFRRAVLDKLGAEYTREDLRNEERWRVKFLESIQGGGDEPTGTITITENGLHNVKAFAEADVNVAGNQALMDLLAGNATGDVTVSGVTDLSGVCIVLSGFSGGCNMVTKLTMPDVVRLGQHRNADSYGTGILGKMTSAHPITEIHLPECERLYVDIPNGMFSNLSVLDLPKLYSGTLTLGATNLTSVNLPAADRVLLSLKGSVHLTSIDMPLNVGATSNAFQNCTALVNVNMPKLQNTQGQCFQGCTALEQIKLPKCSLNGQRVFQDCTSLALVEALGGTVGNECFRNCTALTALVLRGTVRRTGLSSTNAFTDTPIASGTGYIYVPRDMISGYETATNWSVYAGQFRAVEDYTADGTVDGEFIPPAN